MSNSDESYFNWLLEIVGETGTTSDHSHLILCEALDRQTFEPTNRYDQNRAEDGTYLRKRFNAEEPEACLYYHDLARPCTILEMLIALSERMFFASTDEESFASPRACWLRLLSNIGLINYIDEDILGNEGFLLDEVEDITDILNHNKVNSRGYGGLFPRHIDGRSPANEQPIWEQMQDYMAQYI